MYASTAQQEHVSFDHRHNVALWPWQPFHASPTSPLSLCSIPDARLIQADYLRREARVGKYFQVESRPARPGYPTPPKRDDFVSGRKAVAVPAKASRAEILRELEKAPL